LRRAGEFQHADGAIAEKGQNQPQGLGQDDAAHRLAGCHTERVSRFLLALVDGAAADAHLFRQIGTLVDAEAENSR
jgi:hypothetical protein